MERSWPLNSRRVALGLPSYVHADVALWNVDSDDYSMRPFSMPAFIDDDWRTRAEWYRAGSTGLQRLDGPAILLLHGCRWFWNDDYVVETHHRWRRRAPFLLALRGAHFSAAIVSAL